MQVDLWSITIQPLDMMSTEFSGHSKIMDEIIQKASCSGQWSRYGQ